MTLLIVPRVGRLKNQPLHACSENKGRKKRNPASAFQPYNVEEKILWGYTRRPIATCRPVLCSTLVVLLLSLILPEELIYTFARTYTSSDQDVRNQNNLQPNDELFSSLCSNERQHSTSTNRQQKDSSRCQYAWYSASILKREALAQTCC